MTDLQKLVYSVAAGFAAIIAISMLYYYEGREPNKGLVGAAGVMASIGLWHFLGRKSKS